VRQSQGVPERSRAADQQVVLIRGERPDGERNISMENLVEIQNIEEMRLREGIDDVELREEVRGLRAGDVVKLTFLTGTPKCETLLVRITSRRGGAFRGELAGRPRSPQLAHLQAGSPVAFTSVHIHSIAKRQAMTDPVGQAFQPDTPHQKSQAGKPDLRE
jgi:hypothetical protein